MWSKLDKIFQVSALYELALSNFSYQLLPDSLALGSTADPACVYQFENSF